MFRQPRFRASFQVHVKDRQLVLVDEYRSLVLEGDAFACLGPLLDGQRTLGEIAGQAAGRMGLPQVYAALHQLAQRGLIVEGDGAPADERAAVWELARGGERADGSRSPARLAICGVGEVSLEPLRELLRADGYELVEGAEQAADTSDEESERRPEADLLVVVTDDYLRPGLAEINRRQWQRRRPWLLIKLRGAVPWIGPLFDPEKTGCWECLAQRLRSNRQMEQYIQQRRQRWEPIVVSRASLPAAEELACSLAAAAAGHWLASPGTARVAGRLLTFDTVRRRLDEHALVRRPQCGCCGDPEMIRRRTLQPIRLKRGEVHFREDGGHRTVTPAETFARLQHHISPHLGAVSELVPALGQQSPLTPCFVAGHNFSMGLESIAFLRESVRGMSGGKGASEIQAKVSGLCEAIERYSGLYRGDTATVRGSLASLPDAIHPNACMGFSAQQFRTREEWNASQPESRCLVVPRPFDEQAELDWTPLWSLTGERFRYLPSAFCYYGHPEFRGRWCSPDSNGSAAGNTLEEAILQGFMELVERDAVALWWYDRVARPAVEMDSFGLPYVTAIQEYYASLHREIWMLDLTSDLGVPAMACVSAARGKPTEDILVGFGAHFDPQIALLRAITEVNQFLPSVSRRKPDGSTIYLFGDELAHRWWTTARVEDNDYLLPRRDQPPRRRQDFLDESGDDLRADVECCVQLARRHGLELLVLDQTQPEIELSVAKVVVPELCHFWRRLGKRRLYEVPVAMGWRETPLAEHELNPQTIFF